MAPTGAVVERFDVYRSREQRDRGGSSRLERYKAFIRERPLFVCII